MGTGPKILLAAVVIVVLGSLSLAISQLLHLQTKQTAVWKANAFLQRGEYAQAIQAYTDLIRRYQDDYHLYHQRALAYQQLLMLDEAVRDLTRVIDLTVARGDTQPFDPVNLYERRSHLNGYRGDYRAAAADLERCLGYRPTDAMLKNNLAWLLATCPDAAARSGRRALVLAQEACAGDGWKEPHSIDTLAAACAETGNFTDAVHYQQMAIDRATDKAGYLERMKLYQSKKPCRAPPASAEEIKDDWN